jgi:hypothetical protein
MISMDMNDLFTIDCDEICLELKMLMPFMNSHPNLKFMNFCLIGIRREQRLTWVTNYEIP